MSESAPLLSAKLLAPSPGPFHLTRERLHARIDSGLAGRATVVLGGPGYGKTGLLARYLQTSEVESAWLRLDGADRDPWTLFRYLIAAIRGRVPEFAERSAGLWEGLRSRPEEVERLADVFIRDAEESLSARLVVVLDGVEWLEAAPECVRALRRLLAYCPPALHLMLTARSLPELGIAALLSQGEIRVLHGDELRFTPEEVGRLLVETFGLRATPQIVARAHARTRGWVTALQLLRQTARLDRDADLPEDVFDRTEAEVFEYFSEEVLAGESPSIREFLLSTCWLSVVDPELAGEVVKDHDPRAVLARLAQRSLFVSSLGERSDLYAYDPLFRDFLERKCLAELGARRVRELHRTYGRALAAKGDAALALGHLLAAEDSEGVSDVLEREGRALLRSGALEEVRAAANDRLRRGSGAAFVHDLLGEAARLTGDYAAAVAHFDQALARRAAKDALGGRARAATLQGLAYSLLKVGEMDRAAEAAEEGLAAAVDEDPGLTARILNTLSIVRYREDRHQEAIAGWEQALTLARAGGDEQLTLMIAHNLGLPYAVTGEFRRASECFRMLTRDENVRLGPEEGAAYLNLARIATLRGEHARAESLLDDAREIAQKWKLQALAADVMEARGTLLRETGHLDAAAAKYADARALFRSLGLLDVLDSLEEEEAKLAARRGDLARAERTAAGLVNRARESGAAERLASALLCLGEIQAKGEDPGRAAAVLTEAGSLFESSGHLYERCMAELWRALALARAGEAKEAKRAAETALRIAARFDYDGGVAAVANLDPALRRVLASLPATPAFLLESEEAAPAAPSDAIQPDRADLTIRLFGPAEVHRDPERGIPSGAWRVRKALRILCYLASSRNHRATKDRLVEVIWGDARAAVIDKNFHPTISFLRRALNHGHHVPKNFVLCEAGAYRLNPAYGYDIDVEAFEARIQSARRKAGQKDVAGALADFEQAFELHRGAFLEDEDEAWVMGPRAHYETLHASALAEAAQLHVARGNPATAATLLSRRIDHDPVDEEASVLLMKALAAQGLHAAIEKEYRRLEKALRESSARAPGADARRIFRASAGEGPEKRTV